VPQQAITLELDELDAEHVEQACFEAGAVSVVLTDCRDDAILEPAPGEVRLWPATRLQALYTEPLTAETLAQLAIDIGCAPSRLQVSEIADRVWEREWLRDFQPMRFGERLWICPSHASVDDANAVVIKLDPGLAFGTGTHPTTALCLQWLDSKELRGLTLVDYGCGSGILGIAALLLGAERVHGIDNDPQALIATADNCSKNSLAADRFPISMPHSFKQQMQDGAVQPVAGVMANILAGTLIQLASHIVQQVKAGGWLLLSGILRDQASAVIAAYSPWCRDFDVAQEGDWVRITAIKQ